jgi:hypothetical protein
MIVGYVMLCALQAIALNRHSRRWRLESLVGVVDQNGHHAGADHAG